MSIKLKIDKRKLADLYIEKKLPARKCAEILGCSDRTILNRLYQFGITVRDFSISHKGNKYPKISQSRKGTRLLKSTREKISKALKGHKSWNKGLTKETDERVKKISKANKGQIPWNKETKGLMKPNSGSFKEGVSYNKGEKNGNWKGGISDECKLRLGQRKWMKLAIKVRKRDNHRCQRCGYHPAVQVHHIIPWRLTHNDDLDNLITLCCSCHPQVDNVIKLKVISNVSNS